MAVNGGNFNEDEFDDLEPVLDEDSFSFDLEPPELDEVGLDSMVASAGDDYPESSDDLDLDSSEQDFETNSDIDFEPEVVDPQENNNININSNDSDSDFDLNLDMDLDLDLDEDDPGIDEKIEEIVNEDKSTSSEAEGLSDDDFDFDELDGEDEPITLSMDELENITNDIDPENVETVDAATSQAQENSLDDSFDSDDLDFDLTPLDDSDASSDSSEPITGENFTDEELDDILGTDIFEAEEDHSDEPIALSMDELENIMAEESEVIDDSADLAVDPETLDLDMDTPPPEDSIKDELEFPDSDIDFDEADSEAESDSESDAESDSELGFKSGDDIEFDSDLESADDTETLFDDDDIADEPITLSMDELSAITGGEEEPSDTEVISEEDSDFDFSTSMEDFAESSVDSLSEDSFSDLPDPDDTMDFEEFTLGDEDVSAEDTNLLSDPEEAEETEAEDENLTLSDEELGNILGADDELPVSNLFDGDDEISLLPEEDDHSELDDSLEFSEPSEVSDFSDSDDNSDLDSGIISDLSEPDPEEESSEFDAMSLDEEDLSDEPITLSSDELNDIIGDLPPGEDLETMDQVVEEEIIEPEEDLGFDSEKTPSLDLTKEEPSELIDLDEFADEGELSPLEELRSAPKEEAKPAPNNLPEESEENQTHEKEPGELSPEEKKKVLTYLDNLLGNLPEDLIKEFSKSNYFDLYKKMMKEIGL